MTDGIDLDRHLGSVLRAFLTIQAAFGDQLPTTQTGLLNESVEHWRDPIDPSLVRLTPAGGSRKDWLDVLRDGVQSIRDGLIACHYHLAAIESIESKVIETLRDPGRGLLGGARQRFQRPAPGCRVRGHAVRLAAHA